MSAEHRRLELTGRIVGHVATTARLPKQGGFAITLHKSEKVDENAKNKGTNCAAGRGAISDLKNCIDKQMRSQPAFIF